jgi:hypothetical protein
MTGENDPLNTTPSSSGKIDREAGEYHDRQTEIDGGPSPEREPLHTPEWLKQRLEDVAIYEQHLDERQEMLRGHGAHLQERQQALSDYAGYLEEREQALDQQRENLRRYTQLLSGSRRVLTAVVATMSGTAFVGAALDSIYNFLPYATPEIWLGASITLAGLAIGTRRKQDPEGQ